MKGWMYILECSDGSFYTGSTVDLERRFLEHQEGEGANHTSKRLPVKLMYFEEYNHVSKDFDREKKFKVGQGQKK